MLLITRRHGDARQRYRSGLWGNDTCPARLTDRSAAADVEGYQISDRVEGLVLELILRSLVHGVRLNHDLPGEYIFKGLSIFIKFNATLAFVFPKAGNSR